MATQFTVFQQLPPELRLKIWQFSIPTDHVTELDAPYSTRQQSLSHWLSNQRLCDMRNASRRNGGPPAVGRVCREARQVVQENGCYLDKRLHPTQANDTFNKITGQWFQHQDIVHLNWDLKYDSVTAIEDEPSPVPSLKACAQFAKSVSITNELLLFETFFNGLERDYHGKPFLRQRWVQHLQLLGSLKECFVCLMSFNIHAPAQLVDGKHLFDSPIRLVSPFDHKTLERMHRLWEDGLPFIGHGVGDGESEILFREILNRDAFEHQVHTWREDVCDLWLFYRYTESWARIQGPKQLLWEPPADVEIFDPARINLKGRHWNNSHPWVMAELDAMPKFKPVIMFRHCTKNCFDFTPYLRPSVPGFPPTMGPPLRLNACPGYFDFRPVGPH
ncbi:hypothetical protein CGCS363_v007302 [Colletotrichum siamense]|uniref:uncharacterized protein n=1 Tax=Colletotrichum siamense TaxID=690259 RepID=UPI001872AC0F|nr:uncharacterized protein CGCS363_v007302 [Colletotrichum siamense]KAF5501370.1 hypothetical protein CGCS363_v007302 [Colletotrichum siamense]